MTDEHPHFSVSPDEWRDKIRTASTIVSEIFAATGALPVDKSITCAHGALYSIPSPAPVGPCTVEDCDSLPHFNEDDMRTVLNSIGVSSIEAFEQWELDTDAEIIAQAIVSLVAAAWWAEARAIETKCIHNAIQAGTVNAETFANGAHGEEGGGQDDTGDVT